MMVTEYRNIVLNTFSSLQQSRFLCHAVSPWKPFIVVVVCVWSFSYSLFTGEPHRSTPEVELLSKCHPCYIQGFSRLWKELK